MSTDWSMKAKGGIGADPPQKPGRAFARKRDQWIAERTPARRRKVARARLDARVAVAKAARLAKAGAA